MLVQNIALAGHTLRVSSAISEDNQLILDKTGCVDVTDEAARKLLIIPGFISLAIKDESPNPSAEKPNLPSEEAIETGAESLLKVQEEILGISSEKSLPKEGDTKVEDGKAYVFRKHGKTGVLDWFRDAENDLL